MPLNGLHILHSPELRSVGLMALLLYSTGIFDLTIDYDRSLGWHSCIYSNKSSFVSRLYQAGLAVTGFFYWDFRVIFLRSRAGSGLHATSAWRCLHTTLSFNSGG